MAGKLKRSHPHLSLLSCFCKKAGRCRQATLEAATQLPRDWIRALARITKHQLSSDRAVVRLTKAGPAFCGVLQNGSANEITEE